MPLNPTNQINTQKISGTKKHEQQKMKGNNSYDNV